MRGQPPEEVWARTGCSEDGIEAVPVRQLLVLPARPLRDQPSGGTGDAEAGSILWKRVPRAGASAVLRDQEDQGGIPMGKKTLPSEQCTREKLSSKMPGAGSLG